jgi:hypothetical protein
MKKKKNKMLLALHGAEKYLVKNYKVELLETQYYWKYQYKCWNLLKIDKSD